MRNGKHYAGWDIDQRIKELDKGAKLAHRWTPERKRRVG